MTDTPAVKELKAIINSALTEQVQQVSMQGRIYRHNVGRLDKPRLSFDKYQMPEINCSSVYSQCPHKLKAGFHMIADDRGSRIADRRKFCDRLRSYGNTLLRSPAILRS